jgi:hypothetical protein
MTLLGKCEEDLQKTTTKQLTPGEFAEDEDGDNRTHFIVKCKAPDSTYAYTVTD